MTEQRFCEIEEKLAYHEHIIQQLSDVIYQQQKQIDRLELTSQQLTDKVKTLIDTEAVENAGEEKPPHY